MRRFFLLTTTFLLLSIFLPTEMISIKIWETLLLGIRNTKCSFQRLSVIPIRWDLTVDSEMAFFFFA